MQNFNSLLVQRLVTFQLATRCSVVSAREIRGKHTIFVLVDTVPGEEDAVLKRLLKIDEVMEIHTISGEYDLLAVLELDLRRRYFTAVKEAAQKLVRKIRKLSGVRDTNTIVPFRSLTKREK